MPEQVVPDAEVMYRELGRFFVEFSQLLHALESGTAFYLAGGRDTRFIYAVLAGREAKAIIDAYFALCVEIGGEFWSDDDRSAMKAFRKEIERLRDDRNRFAHDTWFVGWTQQTGDGPAIPAPHEKLQIPATKSGVEYRWGQVTVEDIREKAADADRLRRLALNVLGLVNRYASEHGADALVGTVMVGDGSPRSTPRISELLKVRDGGQVEWATWKPPRDDLT